MSLTMQHIISDAQTLCTRLKDHESLADRLISQTQSLYKQVDAMKQYEEEVSQLNEVAHQKPRDALVQGIQQENRHLRELQQENKELRNSLEEHQNTLEIVMSNYRKQVTQLMQINKSDRQLLRGQVGAGAQSQCVDAALLEMQSDKIQEMALVMRRAVELDEQSEQRAQEAIAQLTRENRGLRELLRVTYSYNGGHLPSTAGPAPLLPLAAADTESSGSLSDSPGSQTVRRRPSADSSLTAVGGGEASFQTVRRRLSGAGKAEDKPAAPAETGTAGCGPAEGRTPTGAGSPGRALVHAAPAASPTKLHGEGQVPPVPSSAPPKVPAMAARTPAVAVRSPPTGPPQSAPPATPPTQPAPPATRAVSPSKSASPLATKPASEAQPCPQISGPATQEPATHEPRPTAQPASKPAPPA